MLDVGVVLGGIGHDMVLIMIVLPPAKGEPAEEVCD